MITFLIPILGGLFLIFSFVGTVIAALTKFLYYVVNIPIYPEGGLAVIDSSWAIMRNFANMFFIVALIMMAFATIINITKYEARTLFPKFLVSAILLNFSLVLGVMVIQGIQILTNTFLLSIGDMSGRLGDVSNLTAHLPSAKDITGLVSGVNATEQIVFGTVIRLIFSVVLLFTFAFSLLTAVLFAVIRIPILWALLIVSPIAWILNIFPTGQGTFKKWWSIFIGWNMFLPIFLFFLYFGLYFLQNQAEVIAQIAAESRDTPLPGGFSFQLIFFYILVCVFLIGGTMLALKCSMFSGTGVVSVAKFARGAVSKRLGMYVPGKGYVSIGAAGQAAKERWQKFKEGLQWD